MSVPHDLVQILLHPLAGRGYQFWSGIGSGSPILAGFAVWAKHHNCHQSGCWRIGHHHPDHGLPVCRRHYHQNPGL